MKDNKYILDGHKPVPCDDVIQWGKWFETADREVDKTQTSDDVCVSTVFLGLDHSFRSEIPILFETIVFGGELNEEIERYATWEQAEQGHKKWVEKAIKIAKDKKPCLSP